MLDWTVSSVGIGTYLGAMDDATDRSYTDALIAAGENGINLFDCAINYRHERSERNIGAALKHLRREDIVVCTKAGFVIGPARGAEPGDIVGGMHCMSPDFLSDQIERSRANLGVDTIDVFYVHNPETQLGYMPPDVVDQRLRAAFMRLEQLVGQGKIRYYGVATWDGLHKRKLSVPRLVEFATEAGGAQHHFRFIQLPINFAMVDAFVDGVLDAATHNGIAAVASASLMQTRVLKHMPDGVAALLPGLETDAQRAIQFTRSTPGISVALVGMSKREHVLENVGVARVPPLTRGEYMRFFA